MELDVLEEVSKASGKNEKLQILKDNVKDKRLAELLDATFNYHRKFYVNKFDMPVHEVNQGELDLHDQFLELLDILEKREKTGHDAKFSVEMFFGLCSERQKKWYAKVLRKDLKAGFSASTAIKAGFKLPEFDVMLAKDGKQCKKLDEIIANGVFVTPKYDGYRCLAILNEGEVTLYSRNGTVYENFPSISESLSKCFPTGKYVFDGEIMSDDFQAMQKSAFANKRGTTVGDVKYHVFGYIDYNEWVNQDFKQTTFARVTEMYKLAKHFDSNLQVVQHTFVNTKELVLKMEMQYLQQGFEGAMALPDIPYYTGKKSNRLLKFKTMLSQDCEIIGFYEGTEGTRNEGRLGGLVVRQENGEVCECGTGFSDEDRDYIWNNQDEFLGRIAEIKYQEETKDGIMRFPVFMRWRDLGKESGKI